MNARENERLNSFFTINWDHRDSSVACGLERFQQAGLLTDVVLLCGGKRIKCHRVILAASSQYFEELFTKQCTVPDPFIVLKDMEFRHVDAIVKFVYTGKVVLIGRDLVGFLKAADSLKINGLITPTVHIQQDEVLGQRGQSSGNGNFADECDSLKNGVAHLAVAEYSGTASPSSPESDGNGTGNLYEDQEPLPSSSSLGIGKQTLPTTSANQVNSGPFGAPNDKTVAISLISHQSNVEKDKEHGKKHAANAAKGKKRSIAYKTYTDEKLIQALAAIQQGMPCSTAAKEYGIPVRTLYMQNNKQTMKLKSSGEDSSDTATGSGNQDQDGIVFKSSPQ